MLQIYELSKKIEGENVIFYRCFSLNFGAVGYCYELRAKSECFVEVGGLRD
jgi:hypothetical protein